MNSSRFVNSIMQRNPWNRCFSSTKQTIAANDRRRRRPLAAVTIGSLACYYYVCLSQQHTDERKNDNHTSNSFHLPWRQVVTHCREEASKDFPSGYSECKRFYQVFAYHRELLKDYQRRWPEAHQGRKKTIQRDWPRRIPKSHQVGALEFDLQFCEQSQREDVKKKCQDLKFRIASFYIYHASNPIFQKRGVNLIKDLATKGHADGMCLYGLILNEGGIDGLESDPKQAVKWWRRCVDAHRHITATYELAVALYTGDGVAENTELAVNLFRRAAHLGHAGAAYMLGECLLDGVGIDRDRADALEWLVTAAELGHHLARVRVFTLLNEDYQLFESWDDEYERKYQEAEKWDYDMDEEKSHVVNIERRFSVGGGSKNPMVLAKRKTVVAESRGMKYPTSERTDQCPG